jgi:biopolymer transport protein ExbD
MRDLGHPAFNLHKYRGLYVIGNHSGVCGVYSHMDFDRLRSILAVPFASLFLILLLCTLVVRRPQSVGIAMPLPKVRVNVVSQCYDDRMIVIRIKKDRKIWINETQVSSLELRDLLAKIFEGRGPMSDAYILPDPDLTFGDFVDAYSRVSGSAKDLPIGVVTPKLDYDLQQCSDHLPVLAGDWDHQPVCGLIWPDHRYQRSCLSSPAIPVVKVRPRSPIKPLH